MTHEPLILAFDTSAAHCAAALLRGDDILSQRLEPMARGQAERLMPLLEEILTDCDASFGDLQAIAVGIGPGNFTGIRISVSAARGLALGLDVPAIGVSSLDAQAFGRAGTVISSLDARRDHLYLQIASGAPGLYTLDTLPPLPQEGSAICIGHMADDIAERCHGSVAPPRYPTAEAIARVAARRFGQPDLPPPAPLYLRDADAAPSRDRPPVLLDE
ncbi:MAG: tRNA (adenosine(37)-N6)-threonylcarbamoyltransferase complex dimerization subunit type 1 TsaB [Alphaproteobacteria bacterium MedPE-SWcel]|nr:MAG: tRNA (adenosine(37)-N6)-threonylcarbamoyltransferase complex dimerization subunit type 1 TsaB [Alphaproteobacteria bacterium MedPE-SWcel]